MPIKTIHDRRLAYLMGLERSYQEMGYSTRVNARDNILEIYQKGTEVPKTNEEMTVEKWID